MTDRFRSSQRIQQETFLSATRVGDDDYRDKGALDRFCAGLVDDQAYSGIICVAGVRGSGKSTLLNRIEDFCFNYMDREPPQPPLCLRLDVGSNFDSRRFPIDLLRDVCRHSMKLCLQRPRVESPLLRPFVLTLGHVGQFCWANLQWAIYAIFAIVILYVAWVVPQFFSQSNDFEMLEAIQSRSELRVALALTTGVVLLGSMYQCWRIAARALFAQARPSRLRAVVSVALSVVSAAMIVSSLFVNIVVSSGVVSSGPGQNSESWRAELVSWIEGPADAKPDPGSGDQHTGEEAEEVPGSGSQQNASETEVTAAAGDEQTGGETEGAAGNGAQQGETVEGGTGGGGQQASGAPEATGDNGDQQQSGDPGGAAGGGAQQYRGIERVGWWGVVAIVPSLIGMVVLALRLGIPTGIEGWMITPRRLALLNGCVIIACLVAVPVLLLYPIVHFDYGGSSVELVRQLSGMWYAVVGLTCLAVSLLPRWWYSYSHFWRLSESLQRSESGAPADLSFSAQLAGILQTVLPQTGQRDNILDQDGPFVQQRVKETLNRCRDEFGRVVILIDDFDTIRSDQFHEFLRLMRPMSKVPGVVCVVSVPRYFFDAFHSHALGDLHSSVRTCCLLGDPGLFVSESVAGRNPANARIGDLRATTDVATNLKDRLANLLCAHLRRPVGCAKPVPAVKGLKKWLRKWLPADSRESIEELAEAPATFAASPMVIQWIIRTCWKLDDPRCRSAVCQQIGRIGPSRRELLRETERLLRVPEAMPFDVNVRSGTDFDRMKREYGRAEEVLCVNTEDGAADDRPITGFELTSNGRIHLRDDCPVILGKQHVEEISLSAAAIACRGICQRHECQAKAVELGLIGLLNGRGTT